MSSPALAPPPREVGPPAPDSVAAPRSSPSDPPVRLPLQRRQDPLGRVLGRALAISVALHVVVLLISPLFIRVGDPPGQQAADAASAGGRTESALRAITPIPTEGADAGDVPPVTTERPPSLTRAPLDRSANPAAADRPSADRPSASTDAPAVTPRAEADAGADDGLRPGYSDPRLYVNPEAIPLASDQTRHERYMEHLAARIEALNDSTYGGGPNTDWTFEDAEGRRWGLSEDGLHLGGVTIPPFLLPLPAATGTNQTLEEQRERQRQRDEIQRQEADRERDRIREERARAMRERREGDG